MRYDSKQLVKEQTPIGSISIQEHLGLQSFHTVFGRLVSLGDVYICVDPNDASRKVRLLTSKVEYDPRESQEHIEFNCLFCTEPLDKWVQIGEWDPLLAHRSCVDQLNEILSDFVEDNSHILLTHSV